MPQGAGKMDQSAVAHLDKARSAKASRNTWRVGAGLTVGFGILAMLILLGVIAIAQPSGFAVLMGFAVAAMPFVFAGVGMHNARKRLEETQREIDAAWLAVASDLVLSRASTTVSQLREMFHLDTPSAERLSTLLATHDDIRADVSDAGEIALIPRGKPRVRVAAQVQDAQVVDAEVAAISADAPQGLARKGGE